MASNESHHQSMAAVVKFTAGDDAILEQQTVPEEMQFLHLAIRYWLAQIADCIFMQMIDCTMTTSSLTDLPITLGFHGVESLIMTAVKKIQRHTYN